LDHTSTISSLNDPLYSWRERVVRFLGLKGESFSFVVLTAVSAVALSAVLIVANGNLFAGIAFLGVLAVIFMTAYRVDWGFFLFICMVLVFDEGVIPGFHPLTYKVSFFRNLKENPYLPSLQAAVVNPLELYLFFLLLTWIVLLGVKRNLMFNKITSWFSALLFFGAVIVSFSYGMKRGGEFLPALWELRAVFYFGLMYFFVPQVIQTKEQIRSLMWVCIGAISFKAFQGIDRFVEMGFSFGGFPTLTNHEDPVFFVSLIIMLLAMSLFGGFEKQRRVLQWLLIPLTVGFIVAQRRAAYASFAATMVAFLFLLSRQQLWRVLRIVLPLTVVFGLYLGAFWNSESKVGSVARLVKSSLSNDPEEAGERYYSNLYRVYERYDLAMTVRGMPLTGIGFGNKYDQPIELVHISFPLREFIAHNEILWLLVEMGAIGYFCFWLFFISFVFRGSSVFSRLRDPYLKSVCAVSVVVVINQLVVSYYDLQLTYPRNMIYLGVLMGLLPTIETLSKRPLPSQTGVS
jgi:hypothetical protein